MRRPADGRIPFRLGIDGKLLVDLDILFVDVVGIVELRRAPAPYIPVFRLCFRRAVQRDVHVDHLEQRFRIPAIFVDDIVEFYLLTIGHGTLPLCKRDLGRDPLVAVPDRGAKRIFKLPPRANDDAALIPEHVLLHHIHGRRRNVLHQQLLAVQFVQPGQRGAAVLAHFTGIQHTVLALQPRIRACAEHIHIAVDREIRPAHGIAHGEPALRALFVFELPQHVVELIGRRRDLQVKIVEPILTDIHN